MSLIDLPQALTDLRAGGIVALPTETVYGLCAKATDELALKQIFATKKRPFFDPLIVHVMNLKQAKEFASEWPELFTLLAERFWPGPLTFVVKKNRTIPDIATAGLDTVAIRCPAHPLFLEALRQLNFALAAPSANRFGRTSPTTAAHVESEFDGEVKVVDGGPCKIGLESTVIAASLKNSEWQIQILRPGAVSSVELSQYLHAKKVRYSIRRANSQSAPGHLKEHYQPVSPLVLLENKDWSRSIQTQLEKKIGRDILGNTQILLKSTPQECARNLYADLRKFSVDANHALWIKRTEQQNDEHWEAIWDRIERASSLIL